jgi:hypothetical protein
MQAQAQLTNQGEAGIAPSRIVRLACCARPNNHHGDIARFNGLACIDSSPIPGRPRWTKPENEALADETPCEPGCAPFWNC